MRIAVVGARGQLGAAVVHECAPAPRGRRVRPRRRSTSPTTRRSRRRWRGVGPDAIINCAAYNDVDAAEDHPVDALNVNAFAVRALARAARAHRRDARPLQHRFRLRRHGRSTPYIGRRSGRIRAASTRRRSCSASGSRVDAPRALRAARREPVRPRAGRRSAEGQRRRHRQRAAGRRQAPTVFEDRTVSPTYVVDAARATRQLLEARRRAGLYHCVNSRPLHVARVRARELARLLGVEPRFDAGAVGRRARCAAPRPQYCALSNAKLRAAGIAMPTWQDALARYVEADAIARHRSTSSAAPARRCRATTSSPNRQQHEVSPGESMPAACTTAGFSRSRRIRKSANDSLGGCSLARMPLPDSRRSSSVTPSSSRRAGSTNASTGRRSLS